MDRMIITMTVDSGVLGVRHMAVSEARQYLDGLLVSLDTNVIGKGTFRILSAEPGDPGYWNCTAQKVETADYEWDAA